MSQRWLRGPALEVLVKLGGLQVGDEIKVQYCGDASLDNQLYEATRVGMARTVWFVHSVDDDEDIPVNIVRSRDNVGPDSDWDEAINPKQIGAWRRPK